MELKPNQFIGGDDEVWTCRVTVGTFIEAAGALDISLSDFEDVMNMNIGKLLGLVWYSVKPAAKVRRVTKDVFENEILTFKNAQEAVSAFLGSLKSSMPTIEDAPEAAIKEGAQGSEDPLDRKQVREQEETRGGLKTS